MRLRVAGQLRLCGVMGNWHPQDPHILVAVDRRLVTLSTGADNRLACRDANRRLATQKLADWDADWKQANWDADCRPANCKLSSLETP